MSEAGKIYNESYVCHGEALQKTHAWRTYWQIQTSLWELKLDKKCLIGQNLFSCLKSAGSLWSEVTFHIRKPGVSQSDLSNSHEDSPSFSCIYLEKYKKYAETRKSFMSEIGPKNILNGEKKWSNSRNHCLPISEYQAGSTDLRTDVKLLKEEKEAHLLE